MFSNGDAAFLKKFSHLCLGKPYRLIFQTGFNFGIAVLGLIYNYFAFVHTLRASVSNEPNRFDSNIDK